MTSVKKEEKLIGPRKIVRTEKIPWHFCLSSTQSVEHDWPTTRRRPGWRKGRTQRKKRDADLRKTTNSGFSCTFISEEKNRRNSQYVSESPRWDYESKSNILIVSDVLHFTEKRIPSETLAVEKETNFISWIFLGFERRRKQKFGQWEKSSFANSLL